MQTSHCFASICEQDGLHPEILVNFQGFKVKQKLVFGDKYIFGNFVEFHFVIGFYYIWNAKFGRFHGVFQLLVFMYKKGGHDQTVVQAF